MASEGITLVETATGPPAQVFGSQLPHQDGLRQRNKPSSSTTRSRLEQETLADEDQCWAITVCLASVVDLVASGSFAGIAWSHAYRDNGVSLYCLGFQALSHFLSSALLLLRYVGELRWRNRGTAIDEGDFNAGFLREMRHKTLLREQGVSVCMGLVMLISAAALILKAARKIRFWDKWHVDHRAMDEDAQQITEWLAWTGFGFYVVEALVRFAAARRLRMSLLWHAAVTSVISLLFLLVLGIAAVEEKEWAWKAEPIAAIVLSLVTIVEGIRIVYNHFDCMEDRLNNDRRA
mmetsp:Transcript_67249/g.161180  ORF Transcript_67249/g.161180 Transcript_67249/m.161180 type:complete len:292 (+) Transcript_67249:97-972(+)|eukprot:CAMPEP_0178403680 /NCGR_PEP_ID=MMETSP0689_2-20121128/17495_1 /TAXON_ID=160604 /ORGANISM="Amphidinium massartii, Strain CS-259" /LENGTH=291 /DNA_ID=CAMNT_0020024645 /DNA_START=97 /DNA_END=972 /DNA_ORIENTATION=-